MTTAREYVELLAQAGAIDRGRVEKLAGAMFKMEVGRRGTSPLDALKEMVGIKKPIHQRVLGYIGEGIQLAKPKAGLAAIGLGGALGVGALIKAYNEAKFVGALEDLKKDPEVQAEPDRAESIARMVKRWAPSVAADASILKGTVKNLMKFPDSYLTHEIAKKLSETEKEYAATHGLLSLLKQRLV